MKNVAMLEFIDNGWTVDLRWGNRTKNRYGIAYTYDVFNRDTETLMARKLPGYVPMVLQWADVQDVIDATWVDMYGKHAEIISDDTASKTVYIFADFVVKVGGKDVVTEYGLWEEVKDSEVADMFIPTLLLKDYHDRYMSVQPRVPSPGMDSYEWHYEYPQFMNRLKAAGYYVDDLHANNVGICEDGVIRTFDYSWWRKTNDASSNYPAIDTDCYSDDN